MGRSPKQSSKKQTLTPRRRWWEWLKPALSFVIGLLVSPWLSHWYLAALPAPRVSASIHALRGTGKTAGCVFHVISLLPSDRVEDVHARIQLPVQINNHKVGLPGSESLAPRTSMHLAELGKNDFGECVVVQAPVTNGGEVQSAIAGNLIRLHAAKLPAGAAVLRQNRVRLA